MNDETCRLDVWLHRVRVTRAGVQLRVDRPGRAVRVGDELLFAIGGRVTALRIAGLGVRRGPPEEARAMYSSLDA